MKAAIRLVMSLLFLLGPAHAHDMHASGLRVAVVLFEGVEEIDYAGPMEVFGASGAKVFTVGETKATVESVWGLKVTPDYDFSDLPEVDVLLVPGGRLFRRLHPRQRRHAGRDPVHDHNRHAPATGPALPGHQSDQPTLRRRRQNHYHCRSLRRHRRRAVCGQQTTRPTTSRSRRQIHGIRLALAQHRGAAFRVEGDVGQAVGLADF